MSFVSEFKEFISRGNVMDMAVGVIIGGAFTGIVTALTDSIINPLLLLATGGAQVSGLIVPVPGMEGGLDFSAFISAVINFLIIAFVIFCMVKAMNNLAKKGASIKNRNKETEIEMNPPACPFCLEEVKEGATRCPHCAGSFDEPAAPTPKE